MKLATECRIKKYSPLSAARRLYVNMETGPHQIDAAVCFHYNIVVR